MQHRRIAFILVLILALALPGTVHAAGDYQAQSYNVDIQIESDNVLLITETIAFQFQGGSFSYVFREISRTGLDQIEFVGASIDGVALPSGSNAGQVETAEKDNSLRVTWHFSPIQDSTHVFQMKYRVLGAVRQNPDGDLLLWRAIPESHDYPIQTSQVTLRYPENLSPVSASLSSKINTTVETAPGNTLFTASNIPTDSEWVIRATFPNGSLIAEPPRWQSSQTMFDNHFETAMPLAITIGIGSLLIGLCAVLLTSMQRRREKTDFVEVEVGAPPSDLPPALVGSLFRASAEPAWQQVSATLFALAERQLITFEPLEKNRWASQDFLIRLVSPLPSLPPEQAVLVHHLFTHKGVPVTEIKTSQLNNIFSGGWRDFTQVVQKELIKRDLIDPARVSTHRRWVNTSLLWALISGLLFIVALVSSGISSGSQEWQVFTISLIIMGFSVGQFLSALLSIIVSSNYTVLSTRGLESVVRWKGFRQTLEAACRGQKSGYIPDMFAAYLPYAITLGIGRDWMSAFERTGSGILPTWLAVSPTAAMDGSGMEMLSALMIVSTASTSSDSSAVDAGAGAASGGGSSGAG
ncbi:MAG: DUF2207 domain-containing protein [Anaerolineaceae bacterium]